MPGSPRIFAPDFTSDAMNTLNKAYRGGFEHFCNLQGQYLHIVADLSSFANDADYEQVICSLGVMGTRYIRDFNPVT